MTQGKMRGGAKLNLFRFLFLEVVLEQLANNLAEIMLLT